MRGAKAGVCRESLDEVRRLGEERRNNDKSGQILKNEKMAKTHIKIEVGKGGPPKHTHSHPLP